MSEIDRHHLLLGLWIISIVILTLAQDHKGTAANPIVKVDSKLADFSELVGIRILPYHNNNNNNNKDNKNTVFFSANPLA